MGTRFVWLQLHHRLPLDEAAQLDAILLLSLLLHRLHQSVCLLEGDDGKDPRCFGGLDAGNVHRHLLDEIHVGGGAINVELGGWVSL